MKIEIWWCLVKYVRIEVKLDGRVVVIVFEGFNVEKFIVKNVVWLEGKLV